MEREVVDAFDITWMPGDQDTRTLAARHPQARIANVLNGTPIPTH